MPTVSGWSTGEPIAASDINTYFIRGSRNLLINGDMRIHQRGGTSFTDDTYSLDRWNILSDGATITAQQTTQAPTGSKYSIALSSGTNGKKFGMVQFVENLNCNGVTQQIVALSFKARVSSTTNMSNIKAAVLSWSSTADSLTSDVVSAWGASGTTPTLATNWTFENEPSNLGVTATWATYRLNAYVDTANMANVAVFIWSDSTAITTSDLLYVTDVQLEIGVVATPFERRPMAEELANCQRYYQKSYSQGTAPGTNISATRIGAIGTVASDYQTSVYTQTTWSYIVTMRTAPTLSYWDLVGNASRNSTINGGSLAVTDNVANTIYQYIGDTQVVFNGAYGAQNAAYLAIALSSEL